MALGIMIACGDNANPTSPSAGFSDAGVQSNAAGGSLTPTPVNDNTPKPGSPPLPLIDPSDPNHNGAHYVDIEGPGGCLEGLEHEWTVTVHEPNHRLRTASFHDEVASCEPTTRRAGGHFEVIEVANPGDTIFKWHGNLSCGRYQADIAVADESEEFTTIVGVVINTGIDCKPEEIPPDPPIEETPVEPPVEPPVECEYDDCPEPPVCDGCEPEPCEATDTCGGPPSEPAPTCGEFDNYNVQYDQIQGTDWTQSEIDNIIADPAGGNCPNCTFEGSIEFDGSVDFYAMQNNYARVVLTAFYQGAYYITVKSNVTAGKSQIISGDSTGYPIQNVYFYDYCSPINPTQPVPTCSDDVVDFSYNSDLYIQGPKAPISTVKFHVEAFSSLTNANWLDECTNGDCGHTDRVVYNNDLVEFVAQQNYSFIVIQWHDERAGRGSFWNLQVYVNVKTGDKFSKSVGISNTPFTIGAVDFFEWCAPTTPTNPPVPTCNESVGVSDYTSLNFSGTSISNITSQINNNDCSDCTLVGSVNHVKAKEDYFITALYDYAVVAIVSHSDVTYGNIAFYFDVKVGDVLLSYKSDSIIQVVYYELCTSPLACVDLDSLPNNLLTRTLSSSGSNQELDEVQLDCPTCGFDFQDRSFGNAVEFTIKGPHPAMAVKFDGWWNIIWTPMEGDTYTVPFVDKQGGGGTIQHNLNHVSYYSC